MNNLFGAVPPITRQSISQSCASQIPRLTSSVSEEMRKISQTPHFTSLVSEEMRKISQTPCLTSLVSEEMRKVSQISPLDSLRLEQSKKTLETSFIHPLEEIKRSFETSFINPLEERMRSVRYSLESIEKTIQNITHPYEQLSHNIRTRTDPILANFREIQQRTIGKKSDFDRLFGQIPKSTVDQLDRQFSDFRKSLEAQQKLLGQSFVHVYPRIVAQIRTTLKSNLPKNQQKAINKRFERLTNRISRTQKNIERQLKKESSPERKQKLELKLARLVDLTWILDEIKEIIIYSLKSYIKAYFKQLKQLQESQLIRQRLINDLIQARLKNCQTNIPTNFVKERRTYRRFIIPIGHRSQGDGDDLPEYSNVMSHVFSSQLRKLNKPQYLHYSLPINPYTDFGDNRNEVPQYPSTVRQRKPRILTTQTVS